MRHTFRSAGLLLAHLQNIKRNRISQTFIGQGIETAYTREQ